MSVSITKRALVTGSTAGIGFAIAQNLAEAGFEVIINGRTEQGVEKAMARILEKHPGAQLLPLSADLTQAAGAELTQERFPALDVLVNNLGVFQAQAFAEIPDSEWMRMFESNVMSGMRLSRYYLPQMLEQNQGRIVFVSSESGLQIPSEMIHYGVSKAAQIALARGLAELTFGSKVTVNTILPGPTLTEGVQVFLAGLAEQTGVSLEQAERDFFSKHRPTSLIQRFIDPQEIAPLVSLLCGPQGAAFNGAALRVEGGLLKSAF